MELPADVVVLGIFVADTTYQAHRLPHMGETLIGSSFHLSPGGKGSNQAVASARSLAKTHIITKLGDDSFSEMALNLWKNSGVISEAMKVTGKSTGAAFVFLSEKTGDNAIIVSPGDAVGEICSEFIQTKKEIIQNSKVLITQLEQPLEAAVLALKIARSSGVITILNPAPAMSLPAEIFTLCDYITPNEVEAEQLSGIRVDSIESAKLAAEKFCQMGVKNSIITLGEQGAYFHNLKISVHIPAFKAGKTKETTGAGDAFNGAFAAALARGESGLAAVKVGCAAAAISVTRQGTSDSMPLLSEVELLLKTHLGERE